MGNYGELWGIMVELWGIMVELCGIMGNYGEWWWNYGELWWNYGELWGIMGNYGGIMVDLWGIMGNGGGIMGNYGELWGIMGELWGVMVELWGIMGNYGMSFGVLLIVVFCRRMAPCFHRHVRLSSSQQCSLCATRLPIQGPQGIHFPAQLAKQMKKLNIKALNPSDIGLSVAGGRHGGAWMSCAAALNVVPPRHRAACASAFAEAATAASLPAAGTCDLMVHHLQLHML